MTDRINVVHTGPSTRFTLEADIIGTSVEGNYSTVRCYIAAYNGPSGTTSSQHGAYGLQTGSIDGIGEFARRESTPFLPSGYAQNAQRWRLGPYDVQVPHGADGTRGPVTLRMGLIYGGNGGTNTSYTASLSGFSTIPRATTPTVAPASGSTGQTFTINHAPAVSSFAHDIAYSLDGGATYANIQTGVPGTDTSTDWTPAHSLLPNKTSVTAIVRVITRASAGGTLIGTKTVNVPLTVPASVKPAISSVAFADAQTSGPDIPTLMGGAGRFVQRWSRLIPTVTATGAGGSTVTEATVTQAGQTAKSGEAFGQPVTVSGNVPYSAIATDSRGRTSDPYANTVPVTAYNFPNLPTPLVTRTEDAAGNVPSPTGTYLAVTPGASVSSLIFDGAQKNLLEWRVRTRPVGGAWTTKQDWTSATVSGNTWIAKQVFATYPSSQEFEVEVSIRDLFGKNGFNTAQTVVTRTVPVPSEQVFMDWDGNDGIGIGGYRRYGKLDIHGDAHAEKFFAEQLDATEVLQDGKKVMNEEGVMPLVLASIMPNLGASADANALTTTGWYSAYGWTNAPIGSGIATVEVIAYSADWLVQLFHVPGPHSQTLRRERHGGTTWTDWKRAYKSKPIKRELDLAPGWDFYHSYGYAPAMYGKTGEGIVALSGLIANIDSAKVAAGTVIATLPEGFRPDYNCIFQANVSDVARSIEVRANGDIVLRPSVGAGNYISLNNIAFPAAGVADWTTFDGSLQSGFTRHATQSYGPIRAWKDSAGFVWLGGLLARAATGATDNMPIFSLPPAMHQPDILDHITTTANDALGVVGITRAGDVVHKNGTATGVLSFFSLAGVSFPTPDAYSICEWVGGPRWYVNSWGKYNNSVDYPHARAGLTPGGLVHLEGMIGGGVIGGGSFRLPMKYRPDTQYQSGQIFQTVSLAARARMDLTGDGFVVIQQGSNVWYSLESLKFISTEGQYRGTSSE